MTDYLWPEELDGEALGDVFQETESLASWVRRLREEGVRAELRGTGCAILHLPATVLSTNERRDWISAHRPPGRPLFVIVETLVGREHRPWTKDAENQGEEG